MKKIRIKKAVAFFAKHWITVWLIIVSLLLTAVIIAFASYADTNKNIKRVFVPSKQISTLFTSNYLVSGPNHRSVSFNSLDTKEFTVLIRNYDPTDPTQIYPGSITYTLSAALAHTDCSQYTGNSDETAALNAWTTDEMEIIISDGTTENTIDLKGNNRSDSLSSIVLPDTDELGQGSGYRNVHEWTVTFVNIPLDSDYCVTLTATPNDGSGSITSTLGIANLPQTKHDAWSCFLTDDTTQSVGSFDAFNYTITGSGGTILKFSYDSTKLQVNPVFIAYHTGTVLNDSYQGSVTGSHTEWKTITIPVQSSVNRYDLQMYKVDSSSPSNWEYLKPENQSWVEFEVVQSVVTPEP